MRNSGSIEGRGPSPTNANERLCALSAVATNIPFEVLIITVQKATYVKYRTPVLPLTMQMIHFARGWPWQLTVPFGSLDSNSIYKARFAASLLAAASLR